MVMQAGFFLAPIIYPLGVIPERFHFYLYLWPPTPIIEFSRAVLVAGVAADGDRRTRAWRSMAGGILAAGRRDLPALRAARGGVRVAMAAPLIEVDGVSKSFSIPSVRRETVREHVFGRARAAPLRAAAGARRRQLRAAARRDARHHGPQRLRQEHAAQDPLRHLHAGSRRGPRARGHHADPRAGRRLESRAGRDRQRLSDRRGDGAVAARQSSAASTRSSRSRARALRAAAS